jgi:hypothetical protein
MIPRRTFRRARRALLLTAVTLGLLVGALAAVGPSAPVARAATSLPCDIYASGSTPCTAAYSTIRALYASYNGSLYQIQRSSDKTFLNVGLLSAGGYANAAPQVSFCAGTTCTVTKLYDQSSNHNDMPISPGGFWKGPGPNGADIGANAMALPVTVAGHAVYGLKMTQGMGYRTDTAKGVATGSQPEGIYMVTSSNLYTNQCCWDFGSGEVSNTDTGNGHMNAIEWGSACWFGGCTGSGPWVEADLENGMYSTNTGPNTASNLGVNDPLVSAWEKNNGTSNFTLKYGNATSGGLTTTYSGALPSASGYSPMHLEASVLLGTGGDNSGGGAGEFFESAMTSGTPSDATENAVQAELTTAGYPQTSAATGPVVSGVSSAACMDNNNGSGANGNKVQIWACDGFAPAQNWTVNANGTITIDGGCLDITGANNNNGTLVELWTCNGGANQQWQAQNGALVNPTSGKCLDDPNSSTTNGTQLQIWACSGAANQKWTIP